MKQHAAELEQALADGVPFEYATHMLKIYGELEKLRQKYGENEKAASMGREQTRLAQGKAAITRDPAPAARVDVYALAKKEAQKQGFSTDSPQFRRLLEKLEAAHR